MPVCVRSWRRPAFLGHAAVSPTDGEQYGGIDGGRIAVPLITGGGERYVVHVLPLTSGLRSRAGRSHDATAALFVQQVSLTVSSPPEVIAKSYGLTPAELRVLLAVVEIGGVPEVAEAFGIRATTVKTHLGRIYGKTRTRRQADLVKFVAGFANPLWAKSNVPVLFDYVTILRRSGILQSEDAVS